MLKKLLFPLFFIFNITLSQVNMEYVREKLETDRTAGEVQFNFTIREGNSKYLKMGLELSGGIQALGGNFIGIGKKTNIAIKQEIADSKTFYHLRFMKIFISNLMNEFFIQYQNSYSTSLKQRVLAGMGIRSPLIKNDKTVLNIGIGFMSETEQMINKSSDHLYRFTNYLSINSFFKEKINFSSVFYLQPSFNNFEDLRLLFDFRPSIKISRNFSFSLKAIFHYDSQPELDIEKLDYEIVQMIEYHF